MKWINKIMVKLCCCHNWRILAKVAYTTHDSFLLECTKCGKLKRKKV